ncbi:hypothetical protein F889_01498 [Acinetobacter colistiniresistens]|uniref:Acyltransferase 3 domain-containing protein n=1 Tax=Acinetobacter colistiniresistens TaxID=280145 RepID=N9R899_9GAMM|nr:hypothetical protein F889_01498 [Acinetobacter colistiniresistens]
MQKNKFIGLDLLRFITAIIMVMLHVQAIMAESFIKYLAYNGFYGTSIFFILSGFILTHVYKDKIIQNKFSNTDFLIKRLSALYPIHIFTLLIALSFTLILIFSQSKNSSYFMEIGIQTLPGIISDEKINLTVGDFITYIIESLFLIQAWDFKYLALNAAAWSISTLFFFYLFFKISVKKISKLKKYFLVLFYIWVIYLSIPVFSLIINIFLLMLLVLFIETHLSGYQSLFLE